MPSVEVVERKSTKLKITKKYVNVSVNIVGEYSGLCEEMAQDYLERMDDINCVLAHHGLPAISEPDYCIEWSPEDESRKFLHKMPVTYIKHLSHAYARMRLAAASSVDMNEFQLDPVGVEGLTPFYQELKNKSILHNSHIVTHSESQGVYIPIELKEPLRTEKTHPWLHILGGIVGSSYSLLDELIELAPFLGVALEDDASLSRKEADRLFIISQKGKDADMDVEDATATRIKRKSLNICENESGGERSRFLFKRSKGVVDESPPREAYVRWCCVISRPVSDDYKIRTGEF